MEKALVIPVTAGTHSAAVAPLEILRNRNAKRILFWVDFSISEITRGCSGAAQYNHVGLIGRSRHVAAPEACLDCAL